MPTDRWLRLDEIFAEAMTQPSSLRSEFLARRCGDDPIMRAELAALVAAEAESSDFLSLPALDVFALQVSREGWCVRPGDRIGAYTVEQRLGAGGMGEVWRARDERLGRDVAIKLLLPHAASEAERERRFQHEARAAGSLNHVNVLTVHDVGEHGGAPYLVTECLDGESLRARLSGDALSIEDGRRHRAASCARARCRARARDCASRLEAGEHLRGAGWPRQDSRLRPRHIARASPRHNSLKRYPPGTCNCRRRNRRIHGARTDSGRAGRSPRRHLRARHRAR